MINIIHIGITFHPGEKVLIKTPVRNNKFSYRFEGPFTIIKGISNNAYLVEIIKNGQLIKDYKHVSQIKKFKIRNI